MGACVTGLDATPQMIEIAKAHASRDANLKSLNYVHSSVEDHAAKNEGIYDAVVASEILEHVSQKSLFLEGCVRCLKQNGSIFITTLNKTMLSYLGGVLVAENVLRLLPKGTHDWNMFIGPPQVQRMLEDRKYFFCFIVVLSQPCIYFVCVFLVRDLLTLHVP